MTNVDRRDEGQLGKGVVRWLERPYPLWRGPARETAIVAAVTAFATLMIFVTRPFGMYALGEAAFGQLLAMAGIMSGLIAIAYRVAVPFLIERYSTDGRWNVGRQVAVGAAEIITLAAALLMLLSHLGYARFDTPTVLTVIAITALCATPMLALRLLLAERWLRQLHERRAEEVSQPLMQTPAGAAKEIAISGRDETFRIEVSTLRYVRAEENYVDIVWVETNGDLGHRLLRATLREISLLLAPHGFIQCHRSYLVAIHSVTRVVGNAQGYRLYLDGVPDTMPVSRSKATDVLAALKSDRAKNEAPQRAP